MKHPQNTFQASQLELYQLHQSKRRPNLLLHACCAPCLSGVLVQLYDFFKITVFFSNDNIMPEEEYQKRAAELQSFVPRFNEDYKADVNAIITDYHPEDFLNFAINYKDEKEGGLRCRLCYEMRLRKTFQYAALNHYEYCSTTLTISRQKSTKTINDTAKLVASDYPAVKFFYADFKKNRGMELSQDLSKKYDLYRQDYCGCLFSKKS